MSQQSSRFTKVAALGAAAAALAIGGLAATGCGSDNEDVSNQIKSAGSQAQSVLSQASTAITGAQQQAQSVQSQVQSVQSQISTATSGGGGYGY